MKKYEYIVLAGLASLLACSKPEPGVSKEKLDQFVRVYTGYLQVCISDTARADQRSRYLRDQLAANSMSALEFSQIRTLLENEPEAFAKFLDISTEELQQLPEVKSPVEDRPPSASPRIR
jgi:DNA-binding transcriptional regulator YiaG